LLCIQAFLIVKAPQCALALEFLALKVVRPKGGVPPEILDERERIRAAIKILNRKLAA
jgi:hypothetical protein